MGIRTHHKLTQQFVQEVSKPGMYHDGGGLYLQVSVWGTKSWLFRYVRHQRLRSMGLGPCHTVSLKEARLRASKARLQLLDGIDPIDVKHDARLKAQEEQARRLTFRQAAEQYIESRRHGWRNQKHVLQWQATLATYVYPVIGDLDVARIDTALVVRVLQPIWTTKPETASRLRGRIEAVLDYARVRGHRDGENPARWRGHLDKILPPRARVRRIEHHAALPYREIHGFVQALRQQDGMAALALEYLILTAARTSEVIGATWAEIDFGQRVWTVPAARMKAGREHRVPLSDRALAILEELRPLGGEYVFKGARGDRPLSNMAMLKLLDRMGRGDLTAHGFRSTFRDWAAEQTAYPHEVAEQALAHIVSDKVVAAYRRGDLFDKRRRLMDDWARYIETPPAQGEVMPLRGVA